ncbi:MAG TPA: tetratricopeptide repeat protein [Candidatus Dormibacteraeota bacterium]|nr:tetratricopeptide repeat protein [Candidatus Dormibacteraeota bacterium]
MRSPTLLLGLALAGLLALAAPPVPAAAGFVVNPSSAQLSHGFPADPNAAVRAARALVAAGHLHRAIAALKLYTAEHPREIGVRRFLGDLYYRAGDLESAKQSYLAIVSDFGGDRETYNRLGSVFASENHINQAIAYFDKSLPASDSVIDLVSLHRRKGDLPSFISYTRAQALSHPNDPGLQDDLGQVYESVRQPGRAERSFRRALALAPQDVGALNGLGLAMLAQGLVKDAIANFQQCLGELPGDYKCTNNLAVAELDVDRVADAKTLLKAAHAQRPELPEAIVNLGYIRDERGDWRGAIRRYLQALAVGPFWRDAYLNLGIDYERHHLYALAESVLLKGIAAVPYDGAMHVVLGQTYADQGKTALALAQYAFATHALDPHVRNVAKRLIAALTPASPHPPHRR